MIHLEAYFLDMILQLATMRQPVTTCIALEPVNSMIANTKMEGCVKEWKKSILPKMTKHEDEEDDTDMESQQPAESLHCILGSHYWRNFIKRHPQITMKKAVCFDSKRDDWCMCENVQMLYMIMFTRQW